MGSSLALGCCSSVSEGLEDEGPEAEKPPCAEGLSFRKTSRPSVHGLWPVADTGCDQEAKASEYWPVDVESWVNRSRGIGTPGPTGGGGSPGVGRGNTVLAECGALTFVDANVLASDLKILLPPDAEGGTLPGSCVEGAVPERT